MRNKTVEKEISSFEKSMSQLSIHCCPCCRENKIENLDFRIIIKCNPVCKDCKKKDRDYYIKNDLHPIWYEHDYEGNIILDEKGKPFIHFNIPKELTDLTVPEKMLIRRYAPFRSQFHLKYQQDVTEVCDILPRTNISMVTLIRDIKQDKNTPTCKKEYRINRNKVISALYWLKRHHNGYKNIKINEQNIWFDQDEINILDDPSIFDMETTFDCPEKKSFLLSSDYNKSLNLCVNSFPWLFPGGIGGLYNIHGKAKPIREWARHLLRYKDGRFLHDSLFTFSVFNVIQRRIINLRGQNFIRNHYWFSKRKTAVSIQQEQLELEKGNLEFIDKLQSYSETIHGSDGYWKKKISDINRWIDHHIAEGNGPPTCFIVLSCAENWWPDLRRLMIHLENNAENYREVELLKKGKSQMGYQAMTRAVKKWRLYVNDFFVKRSKKYLECVVKKALGIKHYWGHIEFTPEGHISLHLLCIANDQTYLKEYFYARDQKEKDVIICDYAKNVLHMTADVHVEDNTNHTPSIIGSPLLNRYSEVNEKEEDCRLLARDCMMHFCNEMCLRENKDFPERPRKCMYGAGKESEKEKCDTPGWEKRCLGAVIADECPMKHLQLRRTHSKRVTQFSKILLKSWRANCHINLLIYESDPDDPSDKEINNVSEYVVNYTGKAKNTRTQEKNMIFSLIAR